MAADHWGGGEARISAIRPNASAIIRSAPSRVKICNGDGGSISYGSSRGKRCSRGWSRLSALTRSHSKLRIRTRLHVLGWQKDVLGGISVREGIGASSVRKA